MSRIATRLQALKAEGRKALIPYVMCGDPTLEITVPLMHEMVASGADVIELGMPFSDPFADGETIQLAGERALKAGTNVRAVLQQVARFRADDSDTPVVLMGYLNPIEKMGYESFCREAAEAGVDGLLLVDMPPEERSVVAEYCDALGLDTVFLAAPTTVDERLESIARATQGYLYYVSLKGITGSGALNLEEVSDRVNHIRTLTDVPVMVGFGIKTGDQARSIGAAADGVIVGSVLVQAMADNAQTPEKIPQAVGSLLAAIRTRMDEK
ncbi:MAG: tryptophan synthase subunit alpha [Litorivicinus sp.]